MRIMILVLALISLLSGGFVRSQPLSSHSMHTIIDSHRFQELRQIQARNENHVLSLDEVVGIGIVSAY